MDRSELERLDRDVLIERAASLGVARARVLTRAELVDELILRGPDDVVDKQRTRGFFGVARDLLADVVERGLNLPDAAERIRRHGGLTPAVCARAPAALPTVTLAEIYAAQGHVARAVETIQSVLVREPDHEAARVLLARLSDVNYSIVPAAAHAGASDEYTSRVGSCERVASEAHAEGVTAGTENHLDPTLGNSEPERGSRPADVSECIAIPLGPTSLFIYWAVSRSVVELWKREHPQGVIVVRLVVVTPTPDGPTRNVRDCAVGDMTGDTVVRDLPAQAIVRVAAGWWTGAGAFFPAAHSLALEASPGPSGTLGLDAIFRRTPEGLVRVACDDVLAPAILRALDRVRRQIFDDQGREGSPRHLEARAAERWVYAPEAWSRRPVRRPVSFG